MKSDAIANEQLTAVYDLSMRVQDLKKFVTKNGLKKIFTIYDVGPNGQVNTSGDGKLIFDHYGSIELSKVKDYVRAVKEWSPDYEVWAMSLSMMLIENSCDETLKFWVNERMSKLDVFERGGPTYFLIAMQCITLMSGKVSMTISIKLTTLKLTNFEGKNVIQAISIFRGIIERLKMCDMLPPHLVEVLFKFFQSSSCEQYNQFFANIYAQQEALCFCSTVTQSLAWTDEMLFKVAEAQYTKLVEEGVYHITKKGYNAKLCRPCNQSGHMAPECPNTSETVEGSKPKPHANSTNADGQNNGTNNGQKSKWRQPPKEGESHEREYKGKMEYWCARCKKWNQTHKTVDHKTKEQLSQKNANQAFQSSTKKSSGKKESGNSAFLTRE